MTNQVTVIPLANLAFALAPAVIVLFVMQRWAQDGVNVALAVARMILQLVAVGYVLNYLFVTEMPAIVLATLGVMIVAASWIALRPLPELRRALWLRSLLAIAVSGLVVLTVVTQLVLRVDPWFTPKYVIPLGGMIFATAMNSVSLASERFRSEFAREGADFSSACPVAIKASLIPVTNSLYAVGLVSLPGLMTGQILSGVDPLIAVRYQIMVMLMVLGSGGLAAAIFLGSLRTPAILAKFDRS